MKMNEAEYKAWEDQIDLTPESKALVARIRASQPTRQSTGICGNVRGRYPSRKMSHMVQYDSRTVELPWIYLAEHRDDTIVEYYEQPFPLALRWKNEKGENRYSTHKPDFFVIRQYRCNYVECKPEELLEEMAKESPGKFVLTDSGWTRPAGVAAAQSQGFGYEIWTPTKHIRLARNLSILDEYCWRDLNSVQSDVIEKSRQRYAS
jgi:hypothetical protein